MQKSDHPVRRKIRIVGAALLGAAVAAVALYHSATEFVIGRSGQRPIGVAPMPAYIGIAAFTSFEFSFFDRPRGLPELRFADDRGRSLSLADFRNRPILLNIWATWCVPCRKEMPVLDRLQAELGASQLLVMPLSIDRQGLPVVKKFYEELGLTSVGMYLDQSGKAASELNAVGVPTTLLIDRDGHEIGRKIGPTDWDSPEVVALIREHLGLAASGRQAGP